MEGKRNMKKKIVMLGLSFVLSLSLVQSTLAAEVWSDGDWQLGEPTTGTTNQGNTGQGYTELWSEKLWSDETNMNPPEPSTGINKAIVFDVLPVLENGRMLVPVRDILEPLGASFDWDSKEGMVKAVKGSTVVKLKINSKVAYVNGKEVALETPAKITKGRTMVPLRFISESLGYKVDWDSATTKVTINNQYYFYLDPPKQEKDSSHFYAGNWEIWVPGGYATTDSTLNGDGSTTIKQEYVNGAKGKILSIKEDGSYIWEVVGETIKGVWQTAENGRILLLKGQMESDWYVEKVDQNQIKIYAWGMTEYGTRIK